MDQDQSVASLIKQINALTYQADTARHPHVKNRFVTQAEALELLLASKEREHVDTQLRKPARGV